jgi:hypothetical protein
VVSLAVLVISALSLAGGALGYNGVAAEECTPLKKRTCKKSPYCKWGGKSVRCAVALNACDAVQGKKMRKKCARVSTMQCQCSSQKKRGKCGTCVERLVLGAPAPTPTPDALPDCPSEWSFVNDIPWVSSSTLYTPQGLCAAIKKWNDKNPSNLFFGSDQTQNKYQLAAFLGNSAQETGEGKYGAELCDGMGGCGTAKPGSPCGSEGTCCEKTYGNYFGRGSLQVTCWQCTTACKAGCTPQPLPCGNAGCVCANYQDVVTQGFISSLSDIDQIATDPVAAWGSGIIYWMSNLGVGSKPATQWVSQQNFGGTYQTINGGCECDAEAICEAKSESDCSGSSTPPGTPASSCISNHTCKWNSKAKGGKGVCMDDRVEPRVNGFLTACAKFSIDCSAWQTSCPPIPCAPGAWCGSTWSNAQDNCKANPPLSVCCSGADAACQKPGLPGDGKWRCMGGLSGCPAPSASIGP